VCIEREKVAFLFLAVSYDQNLMHSPLIIVDTVWKKIVIVCRM